MHLLGGSLLGSKTESQCRHTCLELPGMLEIYPGFAGNLTHVDLCTPGIFSGPSAIGSGTFDGAVLSGLSAGFS